MKRSSFKRDDFFIVDNGTQRIRILWNDTDTFRVYPPNPSHPYSILCGRISIFRWGAAMLADSSCVGITS
ncbi:MAG: hypothetical protein J0I84_04030 [Terrimonas sp.]|nr:hypothetical protein [Terrimonas sp.]